MTSKASIRPVRTGDAATLAPLLRAEDLAELRAGGREPLPALEESLASSEVAFAVELGGQLAALGGVVRAREALLGPVAYDVPWLLTSAAVARHPAAFWRASVRVLALLRQEFPVLLQYVDARYLAALRWVARLGAEVQPARPWGVNGELFHPVIWRV